jgi:hypothetical protein
MKLAIYSSVAGQGLTILKQNSKHFLSSIFQDKRQIV